MNLKWPENYQERIESIIGAKYDENRRVYFLGDDIRSPREAKIFIDRMNLMQKGLRQVKSEINNKIKIIKAGRLPKAGKTGGALYALASLTSNLNNGQKIDDYQNVIQSVNILLDACERRKVDLELWIGNQRLNAIEESSNRQAIPDDVQIFVWNRDGGKCVKCGSQENLEFDHVIPLSKGGSNTARNLQLLCETCNREKSNSIGG